MDFLDDNELGFWVSGDDARLAVNTLLQQTQELDTDIQLAVREGKFSTEEYGKWEPTRDKIIAWIDKVTSSFADWRIGITSVSVLGQAEKMQALLKAFSTRLKASGATMKSNLGSLGPESDPSGGFKIDIGGLALPILVLGVGYLAFKRK